MTQLLRSELLRAASRRVVWVLTVCGVVGILVGVTIGAVNARRPTAEELERARASYELALERCLAGELVPADAVPPGYASRAAFCEEAVAGLDQPEPTDALQLRDARPLLEGLGTLVILLGVVLGASLAGADWSTGVAATLLTWESRRFRVLVARVAVVATVVFAVTIALQALFVGSFRFGVAVRGSPVGAPSDWLGQIAGVGLRTSVAAVAFAVVAAALATIGRSTVFAVASLFGYLVAVEGFLPGLVAGLDRWLLIRAVTVVITDEPAVGFDGDAFVETISVARGWVTVVAYTAGLVLIAGTVLRRRDVQ